MNWSEFDRDVIDAAHMRGVTLDAHMAYYALYVPHRVPRMYTRYVDLVSAMLAILRKASKGQASMSITALGYDGSLFVMDARMEFHRVPVPSLYGGPEYTDSDDME